MLTIPSKINIGVVLNNELDLGNVALAVRELLGQVNAVGIDNGRIFKSIGVVRIGALPSEGYGVGVAGAAVDNACI